MICSSVQKANSSACTRGTRTQRSATSNAPLPVNGRETKTSSINNNCILLHARRRRWVPVLASIVVVRVAVFRTRVTRHNREGQHIIHRLHYTRIRSLGLDLAGMNEAFHL